MTLRVLRIVFAVGLLATAALAATAQTGSAPPASPALTGSLASHPGWPKANPADVRSIDSITNAVYDVLSGPAVQTRDWTRFRSLFLPDAQLIPTRATGVGDHTDAVVLSPDLYIARATRTMATAGFFERGVARQVEQFGNIAHVWSTYESRRTADDRIPFARGINSFQLLKDGDRFWIVQILWDAETPANPIPQQFLPSAAPSAPDTARLNSAFTGTWTGQREYRDFASNAQIVLPSWLTMTPSADGNSIILAYIYDDGPTRTVREQSILSFVTASTMATVTDVQSHAVETYQVAGLADFRKRNRGTLTLTGKGAENAQPVDVRITLRLDRNLYSWRKETRPTGSTQPFRFRIAYSFTRTSPPD